MTHALTPFAHQQRRVPYVTDWLERPVRVFPVTCKADLVVSRHGAMVHRIEAAAGMVSGDRIRYAARYLCGHGSTDVLLLANADAHGGAVCRQCQNGAAGAFVYRCFANDGRLLYIGATRRYGPRMAQHACSSPWWAEVADISREPHPSLPAALAAERLAIEAENPAYNRQWVTA